MVCNGNAKDPGYSGGGENAPGPSVHTSNSRDFDEPVLSGNDCVANFMPVGGSSRLSLPDQWLVNYEVKGTYATDGTPSQRPTGTTFVSRTGSPCNATGLSPLTTVSFANGTLSWAGGAPSGASWEVPVTNDNLTACGNGSGGCAETEACSGTYTFTAQQYGQDCRNLKPFHMEFETAQPASAEKSSTDSDCEPGSGHFRLYPIFQQDRDHDNARTLTFLPMQTSGTGVMTRTAWITTISPTNLPSAANLRVLKQANAFHISATDLLDNASTLSVPVNGNLSFDGGILRGDPPFVAERIPIGNAYNYEMDMSWTCGSAGPARTLPHGYQFRLSDIGCTGNQKLTLRYAANPNRVYLEQYGNPNFQLVEPTTSVQDGQAFAYDDGGFSLDATILAVSSTQATVRIDSMSLGQLPLCTPGTYTFGSE